MNGELRFGAALSLAIALMSLAGLFWTPHDYTAMDPARRFLPPGGGYLLGTDNFGRDVFSRVMSGGSYTLLLAVCTVAGAAAAGTLIGLFSGYSGGIRDEIIMRLMDALSSFPGILLALVTVALLDNGQFTLFVALFILFIPSFTRVMRSGALRYKHADFILAERLLGGRHADYFYPYFAEPPPLPAFGGGAGAFQRHTRRVRHELPGPGDSAAPAKLGTDACRVAEFSVQRALVRPCAGALYHAHGHCLSLSGRRAPPPDGGVAWLCWKCAI